MKIRLIKETMCAHDWHEVTNHPRPWYKSKPILPEGTVLDVKNQWSNFYGSYYKCSVPSGVDVSGCTVDYEYDIPVENAIVIST